MIYNEAIKAAEIVADKMLGANRRYDPTWMIAFDAAVKGYQAAYKNYFSKIIKDSQEGELSIGEASGNSEPTSG
jgi:hypothetical protein